MDMMDEIERTAKNEREDDEMVETPGGRDQRVVGRRFGKERAAKSEL